ncbi:uncharacterized protein LOC117791050 isoform X3 [Drosophila innubila]|uniref:uncharacterized protein LOC117791050 isoform X3 n=1 Tax=Drosophila innubila TaxID=198719 RepID=UPI00148D5B14|nr:uncharacterized protein LOC117791050 isoform X3 [Drosophila innubila]
MDSEAVTKINEADNSVSAENSKENVPPAAVEKTSEQEIVDKIDNQVEKTKNGEAVEKEKELVGEVEDEVEEDGEGAAHTETKTTTTVIVTKKDTDVENAKTETKTTTTVIVTKNETDDDNAKAETKTTTTTTIAVVDESPKAEVDEISTEKKPEETLTDTVDQKESVAEDLEESEESDDPSEDEQVDDEEEEKEKETATKLKTEKVEDVKVSEPNPSVSANIQQAEVIKAEEVNNTNKDINNQIENIISDIDINIKAQEKITQLKEQELALIQKQKELANQIHQQQILAQKLIAENQLKEQELKSQQIQQQQQLDFLKHQQYKDEFVPKASDEYASSYNQQHDDFNNFKESSNVSRTVDLRKIFTPATDAPQILPKNRKLYASSAFYSPTLHPTVEDQVELARRISHSLSDISNQTSKGQSMYVNRKKRSVKWVHEGSAQGEDDIIETNSLCKENAEANMKQELTKLDKMPLKLIMNPRGQMRDYNSLKESINIETGLLSPDNCAELITALQLQKGRGAELFAKRRRKAENWVVDETNAGTHSPSGIPDFQQYQAKPSTSPSILPAYSDAGKHRVQLNLHQDQLIEKYSKPGVQVIKSPWEAALQTGSASSAFVQDQKYGNQTPMLTPTPMASVASPVHFNQDVNDFPGSTQSHHSRPIPAMNYATQEPHKNNFDKRFHNQPIQPCNPQRELAYKPSVAQGWGGRNVELPRGLYVPKEISLASYAPPPAQASHSYQGAPKVDYAKEYSSGAGEAFSGFPMSNTTSGFYSSPQAQTQTPKQQLYAPQSYQKVPTSSMQAAPQVNFNPSPLAFEKLSKFQEFDQKNAGVSSPRYLNVNKHQPGFNCVRNVTPTPFGSAEIEDCSTFENLQGSPVSTISKKFDGYQQPTSGQSFNNCARGWMNGGGSGAQRNGNVFPSRGQAVPSTNLPYSDF